MRFLTTGAYRAILFLGKSSEDQGGKMKLNAHRFDAELSSEQSKLA
jgi:hypothetical protein